MKLKQNKITPKIKLYYLDKEPDWDLVKNASQIFSGSIEPFKKGRHREVYLLENKNSIYYAKRFFSTHPEQKLSYFFRKNKAIKCFKLSNQLITNNFKVVESTFILNYHKLFEHTSIFITKQFDGISLLDFYNSDVDSSKKKEVLINLLLTLSSFFKKGFFHKDINLVNFLIDPNKPTEMTFLDFDSISHKYWLSTKQVLKALGMLNYSIYYFLETQNKEHLYTRDQLLFYLEIFIKSYNPKIKVDKAYKYLTQGTIEKIKKNKLSIKNTDLLISRMI